MEDYRVKWVRGAFIGRGAFGAVSLAVDKSDGRLFAVKSVDEKSVPFLHCLENEIRILKSLSSPYIVQYLGDDVTTELSSVVYRNLHMEYMPGGTVADDMESHGDSEVMLRSYTRCIVSALSYIHARNIVHCDVKGKNVLVGNLPGTAKLADFGSAIELEKAKPKCAGTRGSPLWMAPEVIRGEYQGPESDVWSLGCTVIEMVTGKPAWQDKGVDTLFQIGCSDEVPKYPAQLSDELRDFLDKCLRREPKERWTCDQLLQHPFLSPCSSSAENMINNTRWSPRCVFDWSDLNFSDEDDEEVSPIGNLYTDNSNVKQRIGKLASNTGANWESDGWEVVRNVTITGSAVEDNEAKIREFPETTSEYSGGDEEATNVSGSGRANWEYGYSNASDCDYYGVECTTNHARGTAYGWICRNTDCSSSSIIYRCWMFLKSTLMCRLIKFISIMRHIYCKGCITLILNQYFGVSVNDAPYTPSESLQLGSFI